MELLDKMVVEIIAYNEIADLCYKGFSNDDMVMIYGEIVDNNINIRQVEKIE